MAEIKGLTLLALETVGRVLFPPVCAGCRRHVSQPGTLCGPCWSGLRFLERPWCDVLGTPFSHEMGQGIVSADAIANPPPFDKARAAVVHGGIARRMVHGLKYADRTELARSIARLTGLPFEPGALVRSRMTRQQVGLGTRERQDNVRGAFKVPEEGDIKVRGRRLLVVDDVYTTGATVSAAARALRKAGAAKIHVLTFARVLPGGDFLPQEARTI